MERSLDMATIEKIRNDIAKTKDKIADLQKKQRALEEMCIRDRGTRSFCVSRCSRPAASAKACSGRIKEVDRLAYVTVPKDLTKVKSKVMFGLTKRQLVCFGAAVLIGVPLFFLLQRTAGSSTATFCMIVVMPVSYTHLNKLNFVWRMRPIEKVY